jgi:hypothetical protein
MTEGKFDLGSKVRDGAGKVYRDSKIGLALQAAVALGGTWLMDTVTELGTTASAAIAGAAALIAGWVGAKVSKRGN